MQTYIPQKVTISSVRVQNFANFSDITLTLHPNVTVLTGLPGCGKTALLRVLALFLEHTLPKHDRIPKDVVCDSFANAICTYTYTLDQEKRTLAVSVPLENFTWSDESIPDTSACAYICFDQVYAHTMSQLDMNYERDRTWLLTENSRGRDRALSALTFAANALMESYEVHSIQNMTVYFVKKNSKSTPIPEYRLPSSDRMLFFLALCLVRRLLEKNCSLDVYGILAQPGIVLLDDIETHLHPKAQQTILPRLTNIFPNIQFITTTMSPYVLSSVTRDSVRLVEDTIYTTSETWGAEASRLAKQILGVPDRPPCAATNELKEYEDLVYSDRWNLPRAQDLRKILDARYQREEPTLIELDIHIQNREWELKL